MRRARWDEAVNEREARRLVESRIAWEEDEEAARAPYRLERDCQHQQGERMFGVKSDGRRRGRQGRGGGGIIPPITSSLRDAVKAA